MEAENTVQQLPADNQPTLADGIRAMTIVLRRPLGQDEQGLLARTSTDNESDSAGWFVVRIDDKGA